MLTIVLVIPAGEPSSPNSNFSPLSSNTRRNVFKLLLFGTWRPFFAVFFEREPALAMLLACLGHELQLHDIAHVHVSTMSEWFAAYDRLRPADGYTGNHAHQDALFAAIDAVRA